MSISAQPATVGRWFDTSYKLTLTTARALKAMGYVGAIRYVPLPGLPVGDDVDATELLMLTQGVGLQVMLVQHPRRPGWDPTVHDGYTDGHVAGWMAFRAGYPTGAQLWCDFEGPVKGTTAATAKAFIEGHARAVREAFTLSGLTVSFRSGLYCGFQDPLTPEQLYLLHGVTSYWSDDGHRVVATRGTAVQQGLQVTAAGIPIDPDDLRADLLGEVPYAAAWVEDVDEQA